MISDEVNLLRLGEIFWRHCCLRCLDDHLLINDTKISIVFVFSKYIESFVQKKCKNKKASCHLVVNPIFRLTFTGHTIFFLDINLADFNMSWKNALPYYTIAFKEIFAKDFSVQMAGRNVIPYIPDFVKTTILRNEVWSSVLRIKRSPFFALVQRCMLFKYKSLKFIHKYTTHYRLNSLLTSFATIFATSPTNWYVWTIKEP